MLFYALKNELMELIYPKTSFNLKSYIIRIMMMM